MLSNFYFYASFLFLQLETERKHENKNLEIEGFVAIQFQLCINEFKSNVTLVLFLL